MSRDRHIRAVVRSVIRSDAEHKYFDEKYLGAVVSASPAIGPLALMATGADASTRTGQQILAYSVFVRWSVSLNTTGAAVQQVIRMIIFQDMDGTGASFPLINLLGTGLFNGSVAPTTEQQLSAISRDRYRILRDKTLVVSTGAGQRRMGTEYIPLGNRQINFLDGGSAASAIGPGQIYLVAFSGDAANGPNFSFTSRLRYIDM